MAIDLGIDLGTTNTVVAAIVDGKPVVVRISDRYHIPSVVCNDRVTVKSLLVGVDACAAAEANDPKDTIYSIKRLMGARFYSAEERFKGEDAEERDRVLEVIRQVGYSITEAPQGEDHAARVLLGDRHYRPEEIAAMILTKAREAAEEFFQDQVNGVVVTVPAYFNERQRAATLEAGRIAGLRVKALLDEPTAAAFAAGLSEQRPNRHVLVYDLGGGTFDVSLLQVKDSRFRGKNIGGDAWLGGDNFDYRLMDLVAEHIAERYNGYDPRSDEMFRSRIKPRVEEAKQALSEADRTVINIPILGKAPPAPGQTSPRILAVRNLTVTREQFEAMIDDCIQKSLAEVDAVLAERNIKPETVSEVLLIGGSTYIPKVRASMEAKFPGRVRSVEDVHPMYAVAQGAAYYAAALTGLICEKCKTVNPDGTAACEKCGADLSAGRAVLNPELMDTKQITERSIGIGVKKGAERDVFHVIIPKATPYPMETPITHNFIATKPNQVFIRVWAGTNEKASRNSHQGNIVVDLKGREVTIGTPVKVGMRYDDNRVLELSVAIEGREPELHRLEYGSTSDEAFESLEEAIRRAKHFCDEYDEYMSERQRQNLQKHMQLAQDALDGRNERQAERTAESINKQIFFGDTLASLMHTAERLVQDSRIQQNIRNELRQLV
ncbi:MAG: Hsp70 family protein, partial [Planctomycetaceae bacterium]|nr:Hsp70 family protein [Planctomycetaceae bacterium]